jgi:uncharacterized protein YbjT (DUF2867 family)
MPENSKNSSVLVVGATGLLGMEICRQLLKNGRKVRALVRATSDNEKVKALEQMGAETVIGDLKESISISNALKDIDAVISTASSTISRKEGDSIETVDNEGQLNLVQLAASIGVNQFIFISFLPAPQEFPLQFAKRHVEGALKESIMDYTILQAGFFMEVWLSPALGFDFTNSKATIYGEGKNKLNWISFRDVASIAVASLDNEAALNAVVQLGGPEALSPLEVVKIFEKHSGAGFTVEHVPIEALQAQKNAATDPLDESFAGLMIAYAEGDNIDAKDARRIYPFRLTPVSEYANQVSGKVSNSTT